MDFKKEGWAKVVKIHIFFWMNTSLMTFDLGLEPHLISFEKFQVVGVPEWFSEFWDQHLRGDIWNFFYGGQM